MKRYTIKQYDTLEIVYADAMTVNDSGALLFFEVLEGDGSYQLKHTYADGSWSQAFEVISDKELNGDE